MALVCGVRCCFLVLAVSLMLFETASADCYIYECSYNEYCCGYHTCCVNFAGLWYVWILLVFLCCFIVSLILYCVKWRRQATVRRSVAIQGTRTVQTATVYPQMQPEAQQPIFYAYAQQPGYGAIGAYQNQYYQHDNVTNCPPAYQPVETKDPTAPQR